MINSLLFALTFASALGCGLIAGSFFAFSTFVMGALGRLPPAHGIAAMQSINVVVINPWFLGAFIGTAVACALLVAATLLNWQEPGAMALLAGGLLYVAGTFLVTMLFNVPLNDALAAVAPDSPEGQACGAGISAPGRPGTMCARLRPLQERRCSRSRSMSRRGVRVDFEGTRYRLSQRLAKPSRPCGRKITMRMKMTPTGMR